LAWLEDGTSFPCESAETVVRAVNSHEALVEALENAGEFIAQCDTSESRKAVLACLCSALALAKGQV
jgi:hypothetical protein